MWQNRNVLNIRYATTLWPVWQAFSHKNSVRIFMRKALRAGFYLYYSSRPNASCTAFTALSASFSLISTVIRISDVEIILILIFSLNSASNIFAATPGLDIMPAPTMETLTTSLLQEMPVQPMRALLASMIFTASSASSRDIV